MKSEIQGLLEGIASYRELQKEMISLSLSAMVDSSMLGGSMQAVGSMWEKAKAKVGSAQTE